MRTLLSSLYASLGINALFAVLTLVFLHSWDRPLLVLIVSAFYLFAAKRLRNGERGLYKRVRIVSALGLVGVGWLLFSGAYPVWLRPVQVLQLVALAFLVVTVNRPSVKALFTYDPPKPPRNLRAAFTLTVLAPFCAEATLGTTSLSMAWLLLLYVPIYGAGALLIRELIVRRHGGVLSVLALGVAYGLFEEGLALQSLTSSHLYGAADWAPRILGVNPSYTELNLVYHAVFSVLVPIALTELLYPGWGRQPYLRRRGVVVAGIVTLLGGLLMRVVVPPVEDPGYWVPLAAAITIVGLIIGLFVVALVLRPRLETSAKPVRPWPVAVLTGTATLVFIVAIWPHVFHGRRAFVAMAVAAAAVVIAFLALRAWRLTARHRVAAITGALVAKVAVAVAVVAESTVDRVGLAVIGVLMTLALLRLYRKTQVDESRDAKVPSVEDCTV
jgi:hypothetical protein